jgi:hypothetical protein
MASRAIPSKMERDTTSTYLAQAIPPAAAKVHPMRDAPVPVAGGQSEEGRI